MSKKRFRPLGDVIRMGLVEDGSLLRYIYKDQLMAVGRARQTGIEVPGVGILSAGKFEEHAGSKLHRPNQHTFALSGKSLQDIMADSFTDDGDGDAPRPAPPLLRARDATPLLDDPNDDFCRVCGFGGDMLCCETCPATFHKECVGLKALPEGDWWCPQCVCAVCGQARFEHKPLPSSAKQVVWVDSVAPAISNPPERPTLLPPLPTKPEPLATANGMVATDAPADGTADGSFATAASAASDTNGNVATAPTAAATTNIGIVTAQHAAPVTAEAADAPSAIAAKPLSATYTAATGSQHLNPAAVTVKPDATATQGAPPAVVGQATQPQHLVDVEMAEADAEAEDSIAAAVAGRQSLSLAEHSLGQADLQHDAAQMHQLQQSQPQRPTSVSTSGSNAAAVKLSSPAAAAAAAARAAAATAGVVAQSSRAAPPGAAAAAAANAPAATAGAVASLPAAAAAAARAVAHSPAAAAAGGVVVSPLRAVLQGQGKKRKAPEAALSEAVTHPIDTISGHLEKKSNANLDARAPSSHGAAAVEPSHADLEDQLLQRAAQSPNLQAVQAAVVAAFPTSQGSAKRAEKFKQFFNHVMPAGSEFKDRASALAAVAAHLWQTRDTAVKSQRAKHALAVSSPSAATGAVPNSPRRALAKGTAASSSPGAQARAARNSSNAPSRAAPNSPNVSGRAAPNSFTAQARAAPSSPEPGRSPQTDHRSSREQLQGIATTAAGIRADIDAATAAAAASAVAAAAETSGKPAGRQALQTQPNASALQSQSEEAGRQGSETMQDVPLSDREARAAARTSKASQRAGSKGSEGNLDRQLGSPKGLGRIPQSDGPGDEEEKESITVTHTAGAHTIDSNAGHVSSSPVLTSVAASMPATANVLAFSAPAAVATAAAIAAAAAPTSLHPSQTPGGQDPALYGLAAKSRPVHEQVASLKSRADAGSTSSRAAATSPSVPSALEQLAARYIYTPSAFPSPKAPHAVTSHPLPVTASIHSTPAAQAHAPSSQPLPPIPPPGNSGIRQSHAAASEAARLVVDGSQNNSVASDVLSRLSPPETNQQTATGLPGVLGTADNAPSMTKAIRLIDQAFTKSQAQPASELLGSAEPSGKPQPTAASSVSETSAGQMQSAVDASVTASQQQTAAAAPASAVPICKPPSAADTAIGTAPASQLHSGAPEPGSDIGSGQMQSGAENVSSGVSPGEIPLKTEVVCPCSGRKYHFGCLPPEQQLQVLSQDEVWFSNPAHQAVSAELARVSSQGAIPCGQVDESTPVTWQLIRGAAVADPQSCQGYAPRYVDDQLSKLRQVLFAARQILHDSFGRLDDSRTGEDVISLMLQGWCTGNKMLDFSGCHLAVLYVAGVMTSVAVVRAFGPELAEVPLLATRHELRGNALAPLLLHHIESTFLDAGVYNVIMPALPLTEGPSPEVPPPPGQFGTAPVTDGPGLKPWGSVVGYRPPSPGALLEACKSPMLQLPGTPYLMKQLSSETLTKASVFTWALRLNPQADAETLAHAGLLIPSKPESITTAEARTGLLNPSNPDAVTTAEAYRDSHSEPAKSLPSQPVSANQLADPENLSTALDPTVMQSNEGAAVESAQKLNAQDEIPHSVQKPSFQDKTTQHVQKVNSQEELPHSMHKLNAQQELPQNLLFTQHDLRDVSGAEAHSGSGSKLAAANEQASLGNDSDGDVDMAEATLAAPHHGPQSTPISDTAADLPNDVMQHDSSLLKRYKLSSLSSDSGVLVTAPASSDISHADASPVATVSHQSEEGTPGQSPLASSTAASVLPCSPALIRSVATPSRVKIPKQRPTMPLT